MNAGHTGNVHKQCTYYILYTINRGLQCFMLGYSSDAAEQFRSGGRGEIPENPEPLSLCEGDLELFFLP
jgi:hypothetical protein